MRAGIADCIKGSVDIEHRNLLPADLNCRTRTQWHVLFFDNLDEVSHKFSIRTSTPKVTDFILCRSVAPIDLSLHQNGNSYGLDSPLLQSRTELCQTQYINP